MVKVRQTLQFAARFVSCLFCDFDLHFYFLGYGLFFFLGYVLKRSSDSAACFGNPGEW